MLVLPESASRTSAGSCPVLWSPSNRKHCSRWKGSDLYLCISLEGRPDAPELGPITRMRRLTCACDEFLRHLPTPVRRCVAAVRLADRYGAMSAVVGYVRRTGQASAHRHAATVSDLQTSADGPPVAPMDPSSSRHCTGSVSSVPAVRRHYRAVTTPFLHPASRRVQCRGPRSGRLESVDSPRH